MTPPTFACVKDGCSRDCLAYRHGRNDGATFRHTYAVHRLTRWYEEGIDVTSRLPWLSAYMGHYDLTGTESYLQATPELMAIAAARFHARYTNGRSE